MFCTNCGKKLEDTWIKCPYCGAAVVGSKKDEDDTHLEIQTHLEDNGQDGEHVSEYLPKYQRETTDKIQYRSFWKFLLLSWVTFGIYSIYIMYGCVKDLNKVCEGDGKQSKNYIIVALLSMITCGIYGFYWYYVQGERLHQIAPKYGIQIREKGSTMVFWMLSSIVTWGIGPMVTTYILFDNLNILGSIYNGEKTADQINYAEKPHPHVLRNVLIIVSVVWVIIIGGIFLLSRVFSYDASDDTRKGWETEEILEDDSDIDLEMYSEESEIDYSGIDLEMYFGQSEEILQELEIKGDGYGEYSALNNALSISCMDGTVNTIMLEGMDANMPTFHGVKTGMSLNEAETLLEDLYVPAGQLDNQRAYLNAGTGVSVFLETNEETVTKLGVKKLSEEELDSYMQESYVFPDSDKKYLSEDEVRSVEVDKMAIGRNEIFARHGYIFRDDTYQQYFENMPWYKGTVPADQFQADAVFNDFEKKNVELITRVEEEVNGANKVNSFIGMDGWYTCITGNIGTTGHVYVQANEDGTVNLTFRTLEMSYDLLTTQGVIINNTTIQVDYYGYTITMIWSNAENMMITKQGILSGMDSEIIMYITDNQSYLRTAEFN